jgi:hypothetical protein
MNSERDIFLSHRSVDKDFVLRFVRSLVLNRRGHVNSTSLAPSIARHGGDVPHRGPHPTLRCGARKSPKPAPSQSAAVAVRSSLVVSRDELARIMLRELA